MFFINRIIQFGHFDLLFSFEVTTLVPESNFHCCTVELGIRRKKKIQITGNNASFSCSRCACDTLSRI